MAAAFNQLYDEIPELCLRPLLLPRPYTTTDKAGCRGRRG